MANYGAKVSAPGDDVFTTQLKALRFNSEKGAFKIFKAGDASFTTNASGDATATIAHGLNYAPAFRVFRKATAQWTLASGATEYTNSFFPIGSQNLYVKDDSVHHAIHAYADGDNFYIQAKGGKANTAMNFRYYLLVDQSESFSNDDGINTDKDIGMKCAKPGFDVTLAKEYQLSFSSRYKIMQYYEVSKKKETLTLPIMFASYYDTSVDEVAYVDFIHGLGYAPLPIIFADSPALSNVTARVPITLTNSLDAFYYGINYFVDATRVRVYFWRNSTFFAGNIYGNWAAETITVRINLLTENLAGAAFPPA